MSLQLETVKCASLGTQLLTDSNFAKQNEICSQTPLESGLQSPARKYSARTHGPGSETPLAHQPDMDLAYPQLKGVAIQTLFDGLDCWISRSIPYMCFCNPHPLAILLFRPLAPQPGMPTPSLRLESTPAQLAALANMIRLSLAAPCEARRCHAACNRAD